MKPREAPCWHMLVVLALPRNTGVAACWCPLLHQCQWVESRFEVCAVHP